MAKESAVLGLFFNEPTKHWHFEEILRHARISRPQAVHWLQKCITKGLIKKIKPKKKMPYYIAQYESPTYQTKKRVFGLAEVEKSGFLSHLMALPKAKAIILFGSINRWDWYKNSDIDLFIYGSDEGFDKEKYRRKIHREIEVFVYPNKESLERIKPALMRNILEGYLVKGMLDFIEVSYA